MVLIIYKGGGVSPLKIDIDIEIEI